jgi:phage-related holin
MLNFMDVGKSAIYAVFVYLGIKTGTVKVLMVLMMLDSLLGIVKALRLGKKFSFKVLGWGMVSKLTILIIPMIIALMGQALSFDFSYFVIAVMNIIVVSEGISCVTNILSIRGKREIENTDYITLLLHSIRKALTGIVNRMLSKIEKVNTDTEKK